MYIHMFSMASLLTDSLPPVGRGANRRLPGPFVMKTCPPPTPALTAGIDAKLKLSMLAS